MTPIELKIMDDSSREQVKDNLDGNIQLKVDNPNTYMEIFNINESIDDMNSLSKCLGLSSSSVIDPNYNVCLYNNYYYININNRFYKYNFETETCTLIMRTFKNLYNRAFFIYNNKIYFYSSLSSDYNFIIYNLNTGNYEGSTKTFVSNGYSTKGQSSYVVLNDVLYLIQKSTTIYTYDLINNVSSTISVPGFDSIQYGTLFSFVYNNKINVLIANKHYIIDGSTITLVATIPKSVTNNLEPRVFNNYIYMSSNDGKIYKCDSSYNWTLYMDVLSNPDISSLNLNGMGGFHTFLIGVDKFSYDSLDQSCDAITYKNSNFETKLKYSIVNYSVIYKQIIENGVIYLLIRQGLSSRYYLYKADTITKSSVITELPSLSNGAYINCYAVHNGILYVLSSYSSEVSTNNYTAFVSLSKLNQNNTWSSISNQSKTAISARPSISYTGIKMYDNRIYFYFCWYYYYSESNSGYGFSPIYIYNINSSTTKQIRPNYWPSETTQTTYAYVDIIRKDGFLFIINNKSIYAYSIYFNDNDVVSLGGFYRDYITSSNWKTDRNGYFIPINNNIYIPSINDATYSFLNIYDADSFEHPILWGEDPGTYAYIIENNNIYKINDKKVYKINNIDRTKPVNIKYKRDTVVNNGNYSYSQIKGGN